MCQQHWAIATLLSLPCNWALSRIDSRCLLAGPAEEYAASSAVSSKHTGFAAVGA